MLEYNKTTRLGMVITEPSQHRGFSTKTLHLSAYANAIMV